MILLSLGVQGSGKTTRLAIVLKKYLVQKRKEGKRPLVVILDRKLIALTGCIGELAPFDARYKTVWDARNTSRRIIAVTQSEPEDLFCLAWKRAQNGKETIIVIDELDLVQKPMCKTSYAYKCVHFGRQYNIDIFGSARRAQNIDVAFVSEAKTVILHRMTGKHNIALIRDSGWNNAEKIAAKMARLPLYSYLVIKPQQV